MTDAEIIKALELCSVVPQQCSQCPYYGRKDCVADSAKDAIDLIQRQQEEIKLLKQRRVNMFEIIDAFERGKTKGIQELTDKIVEQLEAEKYRGMESLEPVLILISFNFGINKAIEIVKGVQNE